MRSGCAFDSLPDLRAGGVQGLHRAGCAGHLLCVPRRQGPRILINACTGEEHEIGEDWPTKHGVLVPSEPVVYNVDFYITPWPWNPNPWYRFAPRERT